MSRSLPALPIQLSVVTVCMNRQQHLRQTAPRVMSWGEALGVPWEYLVVDWSSEQPIRVEELPEIGPLRLLRVEGEAEWNLCRAYNFAIAQAKGSLLLKLDADCWPQDLGKADLDALPPDLCRVGGGKGGAKGQWLMARNLFESVGGFHELLQGYGPDDLDLYGRLSAAGHRLQTLPVEALGLIHHSSAARVGLSHRSDYRNTPLQQAFARATKHALARGNWTTAVIVPWSCHRSRTNYQRLHQANDLTELELLEAGGSLWQALAGSVPKPEQSLQQRVEKLRRQTFWSEFLELPEELLKLLPEHWFGPCTAAQFKLQLWHRCYWHSGRRLLRLLIRLMLNLLQAVDRFSRVLSRAGH